MPPRHLPGVLPGLHSPRPPSSSCPPQTQVTTTSSKVGSQTRCELTKTQLDPRSSIRACLCTEDFCNLGPGGRGARGKSRKGRGERIRKLKASSLARRGVAQLWGGVSGGGGEGSGVRGLRGALHGDRLLGGLGQGQASLQAQDQGQVSQLQLGSTWLGVFVEGGVRSGVVWCIKLRVM